MEGEGGKSSKNSKGRLLNSGGKKESGGRPKRKKRRGKKGTALAKQAIGPWGNPKGSKKIMVGTKRKRSHLPSGLPLPARTRTKGQGGEEERVKMKRTHDLND